MSKLYKIFCEVLLTSFLFSFLILNLLVVPIFIYIFKQTRKKNSKAYYFLERKKIFEVSLVNFFFFKLFKKIYLLIKKYIFFNSKKKSKEFTNIDVDEESPMLEEIVSPSK